MQSHKELTEKLEELTNQEKGLSEKKRAQASEIVTLLSIAKNTTPSLYNSLHIDHVYYAHEILTELSSAEAQSPFPPYEAWKSKTEELYKNTLSEWEKEESQKSRLNLSYYDAQPGVKPEPPDTSKEKWEQAKQVYDQNTADKKLAFQELKRSGAYDKIQSLLESYQKTKSDYQETSKKIVDTRSKVNDAFIETLKTIVNDLSFWADKGQTFTGKWEKTPDSIVQYRKELNSNLSSEEKIAKIQEITRKKIEQRPKPEHQEKKRKSNPFGLFCTDKPKTDDKPKSGQPHPMLVALQDAIAEGNLTAFNETMRQKRPVESIAPTKPAPPGGRRL